MIFRASNGAEIIESTDISASEAREKYADLCNALVVVRLDDDYLLGYHEFRGDWETFGGLIEPGETIDECIARECEEELGLSGVEFEYLGVLHYSMPPDPWIPEWHEEHGGLFGLRITRDMLAEIEQKRHDRAEIGRIGLYSELKASGEKIDELNERLLRFFR